uniref:Uncharacterized protein n=2 Tax=Caenorhabditis japonica TaxID=281687 RepID=A0A8R1EST7_CAEJA
MRHSLWLVQFRRTFSRQLEIARLQLRKQNAEIVELKSISTDNSKTSDTTNSTAGPSRPPQMRVFSDSMYKTPATVKTTVPEFLKY